MRVNLSRMRSLSFPLAVIAFLLLVSLLSCGCLQPPGPRDEGSSATPPGSPPIVGSWLSFPPYPDGSRDLYLFKGTGRCDATVVPASGILPTSEVHLQGRWEEMTEYRYLLAGEEVTHHFTNDTRTTAAVHEVLQYDALTTVSAATVIPTIPW